MTLKAVLFDLDGTLLDSAPDFLCVINQLRAEQGLPDVSESIVRATVSGGAKEMILASFGVQENTSEFEILRQRFLDLYYTHCHEQSVLYDGIETLLSDIEVAHLKWGIVTNKPIRFATPIIEHLGLAQRCSVLVCPELVTHTKPNPEPLLLASRQLAIDPQHIIYVGDDQRDITAGNSAGCRTIAVRYGYIHPEDNPHNWGAGTVVDTPYELATVIDQAICGC